MIRNGPKKPFKFLEILTQIGINETYMHNQILMIVEIYVRKVCISIF